MYLETVKRIELWKKLSTSLLKKNRGSLQELVLETELRPFPPVKPPGKSLGIQIRKLLESPKLIQTAGPVEKPAMANPMTGILGPSTVKHGAPHVTSVPSKDISHHAAANALVAVDGVIETKTRLGALRTRGRGGKKILLLKR